MADRAQSFIDALGVLERQGDTGPIAALFAGGAAISNPMVAHHGPDGAAAFWANYRAFFDTVRSEFRHVFDENGVIFLEWASAATVDGRDVRYEGVSVLEHGEGGITAFRTYFDPTPLRTEARPIA